MGEGALAAARKLDEGTPSPRNFDRGDHRRLLKSDGAYRTGNRIVKILPGAVNNLLRASVDKQTGRTWKPSGLFRFQFSCSSETTVVPVCRVPAYCWNAARSRAQHCHAVPDWNAARPYGPHVGCHAPRLAVLLRVRRLAPDAILSLAARC